MAIEEEQIWTTLKGCYDPELPCNIVDLGLVYGIKLLPLQDGASTRVDVRMTLTSQGCPMSRQITAQIQQKLLDLNGVGEANVEIVYDPPWSPARINDDGKRKLGLG